MDTRVFELNPTESQDWLREDAEGEEFREFTKRVVTANLRAGTRVEIYSDAKRLLHTFQVS